MVLKWYESEYRDLQADDGSTVGICIMFTDFFATRNV